MKPSEFSFEKAAFYLTCASVVSILFSIAVSNILLALAFAALLISNQRMRFPPFLLPLAVFFVGTVISMLVSVDPSGGRPQIRKFFVYLMVLVVYSTIRRLDRVRAVLLIATGIMTFSALWSLVQFAHKWMAARDLGRDFYTYYTGERITGFMSHWMTLGGQEMMITLMAGSLLLFSTERKWKPWIGARAGDHRGLDPGGIHAQHLVRDFPAGACICCGSGSAGCWRWCRFRFCC